VRCTARPDCSWTVRLAKNKHRVTKVLRGDRSRRSTRLCNAPTELTATERHVIIDKNNALSADLAARAECRSQYVAGAMTTDNCHPNR